MISESYNHDFTARSDVLKLMNFQKLFRMTFLMVYYTTALGKSETWDKAANNLSTKMFDDPLFFSYFKNFEALISLNKRSESS